MPKAERFRVLIRQVRRSSAWQVLGLYLAASWAVLQVVDQFVERLSLPEWTYGFALLLLVAGLPVVVATAVVQEQAGRRSEAGEVGDEVAPGHEGGARWLTWRNAFVGGVVGLALWGLLAAGWLAFAPRPMLELATTGSTNRLAILPFAVRGSGEYAYLREGLVDLLSTKLDGAGDLRTVDPHALLSFLGTSTPVNLAPAAAGEVGERFGAGLVVLGNVVEVAGRLQVNATVYDFARRGPELEVAAEGEAGQLFELVDSLAAQILGGLPQGPGARVGRIAAITTSSLPALRDYFTGDAAFREGRFEEAYEAFTRATQADSAFALAHYRRSMAAEWATRPDVAVAAADAALRHAARLSERDQRQLEAFRAYRLGAFHEAERLYRTIVGRYPDDVEAWNHLGETLFHYAPLHGLPLERSRPAFERVLSYDTFRGASLLHLARVAAAAGRRETLDSLAAAFLETNPEGDRELELLALQAWAADDPARKTAVLSRLGAADDQIAAFVVWDLATYSHRPDGAIAAAAALTGIENPPEVRTWGHALRAYALLGMGRWRQAGEELGRAAEIEPEVALQHRALLTLFPPLAAPRSELLSIRDGLRALDPARIQISQNPTGFFGVQDQVNELAVRYLLGLVHARLGEQGDAAAMADRVERTPAPPGMSSVPRDLAWTIRAEIQRAAGRPEDALAAVERVTMEGWYSQTLGSPFVARAHSRFLRAELLLELGRGAEALDLFATLADANAHDVLYLGIAHLRQAAILAAMGRTVDAEGHRKQVEDLWADADPQFRAFLNRPAS